MQAICSSETSVDTRRTTRNYIQEDSTLHNHRCENLKSYMKLEQFVEWKLAGKVELLGEHLPQCYFFYDKSHMTSNPGCHGGKPATNSLSYGIVPPKVMLKNKKDSRRSKGEKN
jgi:hypothetical protein